MPARLRTLALALPLTLLVAACGAGDDRSPGAGGAAEGAGLQVTASFYPLEFLLERIAGEHAEITTLTSPGVDPHDLELTPRQVASLGSADLVVYQAGMQPAVDQAVATQASQTSFDVAPVADLVETGGHEDEHDHEHGDDAHAGHDHGPLDPHFWLDPQRYAGVAEALAGELAELDPEHAEDYRTNAGALVAELTTLDEELAAGLSSCEHRDVVTTHEAFGYLGLRYDLHVIGITGIVPDAEPSPARLAEITALVAEVGAPVIYAEPLLPDAVARTVATETGAEVLVLDPADGLSEAGLGADYLEIMRANLTTLREGQVCS